MVNCCCFVCWVFLASCCRVQRYTYFLNCFVICFFNMNCHLRPINLWRITWQFVFIFISLDDQPLGGAGGGGAEGEEVGAGGVLGEGDGEFL